MSEILSDEQLEIELSAMLFEKDPAKYGDIRKSIIASCRAMAEKLARYEYGTEKGSPQGDIGGAHKPPSGTDRSKVPSVPLQMEPKEAR